MSDDPEMCPDCGAKTLYQIKDYAPGVGYFSLGWECLNCGYIEKEVK